MIEKVPDQFIGKRINNREPQGRLAVVYIQDTPTLAYIAGGHYLDPTYGRVSNTWFIQRVETSRMLPQEAYLYNDIREYLGPKKLTLGVTAE